VNADLGVNITTQKTLEPVHSTVLLRKLVVCGDFCLRPGDSFRKLR
jgi:hypothetical protein